jgi:hypothetical protein
VLEAAEALAMLAVEITRWGYRLVPGERALIDAIRIRFHAGDGDGQQVGEELSGVTVVEAIRELITTPPVGSRGMYARDRVANQAPEGSTDEVETVAT